MPEQHPEREKLKERLIGRFDACDKGIHMKLRARWDEFEKLYHNYRDFKASVADDPSADIGSVRREAAEAFGHPLFIPMTFATVESTLAQFMANPPHPVVLPSRVSTTTASAVNMGYLIADQQERADLPLEFQLAGKEALMLGLGIVKTRWDNDVRTIDKVAPSASGDGWQLQEVKAEVFDGPRAERVNPRDFIWDPLGYNMRTLRYCFQRSWPDGETVMDRFNSGTWAVTDRAGNQVPLLASDVNASSGAQTYSDTRQGGFAAQGLDGTLDASKLGDIHEVWEYHDGERVVVVLDRKWIVREFRNATRKTRFPFHAFRPMEVPGFFYGKGVIEPIQDLQRELNDARTDRRWNALMALHRFAWYDDNAMDGEDVSIFPGALLPTRGNPNEMIKEGQFTDIPGSAREETQDLKSDINEASGLIDLSGDTGQAPETATGVQLVQAATKHRINQLVSRCEMEFAVPVGRHMIEMNQREILNKKDVRRPIAAPDPSEPDRLWEFVQLGPEELQGDFDFTVVGNSMAAENIPQQRQDAQTLLGLLGNPLFAAQPLAQEIVRKLGYPNPQAYLAPQAPPLPAAFKAKVDAILGEAGSNALLAAAQAEDQNGQ